MTEPKKMRTSYRTTNWAQYNAALKARGSLSIWLDKDMQWLATPNGKRGRAPIFSGMQQSRTDPIRQKELTSQLASFKEITEIFVA